MLYQSLDNKQECVGVYHNGELYFDGLPKGLTKTWSPSSIDPDGVEYAQIYCGGKSLSEVCPDFLKPSWEKVKAKFQAFLKSFKTSLISLKEHCFFDLVPHRFLLEYYSVVDRITNYVFENYSKPKNYDFLVDVVKLTNKISENRLLLDRDSLKPFLGNVQARNLWKVLIQYQIKLILTPLGRSLGGFLQRRIAFLSLR